MRAYLAVIKDSFREAFASRVLWILLVLITLLLLGLSPLAVKDEVAAALQRGDILTGGGFTNKLVDQSQAPRPSPGKHIWTLLSDDLRKQMTQIHNGETTQKPRRVLSQLIGEMNALFEQPDFFNEEAWSRYPLGDEAQLLLDRGVSELSDTELQRLNRLAVDAAYPEHIRPVSKMATQVVYFGYEIGGPLPLDHDQTNKGVKTVLVTVMTLLVGTFGVFVAILVTASIIPQMFEAGAIDLLLSRPLSRSLLFLSKFVGGCAFILLNATYLIAGLWLYVGFRFDIWSSKLLLCIPVFLFLFAIYYAVSAFAGVVWRNAVVSVVMAILFWAACFIVGTSKGVIETMFLNPKRLAVVVPAGETLLAANKSGETFQWEPDGHEWRPVFQPQNPNAVPFGFVYPMVGPIYDSHAEQLVAIESSSPGIPGFAGTGKVVVGKRAEDWRRISGVSTPTGTQSIFIDGDGKILIAGTGGIFRFEGDPALEHVPFKLFGFDLAPRGKAGKFVDVGPKGAKTWPLPFAAARNPQDDSLAVFSRGKLKILVRTPEGQFTIAREADLDTDEPALVAFSGGTVMVALGSGEIQVFDVDTLKLTTSYQSFGNDKPRQIAAAANGRWFAVQFHNQKLALYDVTKGGQSDIDIAGQGNISAVAFSTDNKLLVADRYPRVIEYDLEAGAAARRFESESEVLELVYRYGVSPIYTVFPKPGELDNLVSYLLTDEETATVGSRETEKSLQAERIVLNIWQPVWSNLAFLAVILGLTCLYIERKDF